LARSKQEKASRSPGGDPVLHFMRRDFVTIGPDEPLLDAHELMRMARLRHLPVVRGDRLLGILSFRDVQEQIMAHLGGNPERRDFSGMLVEAVMIVPPYSIPVGASMGEAARQLFAKRIGCLPVVESGPGGMQLLGLLTETDLIRAAYAPWFRFGRS
jgi:CBS domain-containing protein